MAKPSNPFKALRDVELGRMTVAEAAKALDISVKSVMVRLTAWGEHLAYMEWAYPTLIDTELPDRATRGVLLEQISAKIGRSRRQTVRMLTEYAGFRSVHPYAHRQLGKLRKLNREFNLEYLAAKVIAGDATVPDLMNTSETDGVSRSALYRVLDRMVAKHHMTVIEMRKLDPGIRDLIVEKVRKYIEKRQNELVREQIERDKAAAKRFAGRRGSNARNPRASEAVHAG